MPDLRARYGVSALLAGFGGAALSFGVLFLGAGRSIAYFLIHVVVFIGLAVTLATLRKPWRVRAFAVGWLTLLLLTSPLIWWQTTSWRDRVFVQSFDPAGWLGAKYEDRTRFRMIEDLRSSGRLDRLTRESAIALLGEPARRSWATDAEWVWVLGSDGIVDSVFVRLRFGSDGLAWAHDLVGD